MFKNDRVLVNCNDAMLPIRDNIYYYLVKTTFGTNNKNALDITLWITLEND